MGWFKSKSYPDFWNAYVDCFRAKHGEDIQQIRFVAFDTETTGLEPSIDRILSIGCVGIFNLRIRVNDQLECYLEQEEFNKETVKIHGLLKEGALEKVTEATAVQHFLEYIKDSVLVAHHVDFDLTMINKALKRQGLPKLKNKVVDTGYLFQKTELDTSREHFSLDDLAKRFSIPMHDRHTASGDAYITALLFMKIISVLGKNREIPLSELIKRNRVGLL